MNEKWFKMLLNNYVNDTGYKYANYNNINYKM